MAARAAHGPLGPPEGAPTPFQVARGFGHGAARSWASPDRSGPVWTHQALRAPRPACGAPKVPGTSPGRAWRGGFRLTEGGLTALPGRPRPCPGTRGTLPGASARLRCAQGPRHAARPAWRGGPRPTEGGLMGLPGRPRPVRARGRGALPAPRPCLRPLGDARHAPGSLGARHRPRTHHPVSGDARRRSQVRRRRAPWCRARRMGARLQGAACSLAPHGPPCGPTGGLCGAEGSRGSGLQLSGAEAAVEGRVLEAPERGVIGLRRLRSPRSASGGPCPVRGGRPSR